MNPNTDKPEEPTHPTEAPTPPDDGPEQPASFVAQSASSDPGVRANPLATSFASAPPSANDGMPPRPDVNPALASVGTHHDAFGSSSFGAQPGAPQHSPTLPGVSGQVVSGGLIISKPPSFLSRMDKNKLLLFAGGGMLALLMIGAAAFAWYIPNTPGQVWDTGVTRSGKALDSLTKTSTTPEKLKAYETSVISGSLEGNIGGSKLSGSFDTTFDKINQQGDLKVIFTGGSVTTLDLKTLSTIPAGSTYPDLYFQLNGIQSLGLDALVPGISQYDGKWIEVSGDYLKSLGGDTLSGSDGKQISANDIAEVASAAMGVTQQYVFSTSADKAVLVKKSYVGKETVDGMSAYHYKAGVNVAHWRAYCAAVSDAVLSTDAYKNFTGKTAAQISDAKKAEAKSCESNDSVKASDTFDVWIDGHYKLIHKVRFNDSKNPGNYTEIGQNYTGGNKLSLFANTHDAASKSDGAVTVDINLDTNSSKTTLTYKSTDSSDPYDLMATINASTSNKAVTVTPPAGAVQLQDILSTFGLGRGASTGAAPAATKDVERKTDINALQANLEAFYAGNGKYPTLAQINDASWRAANMESLDSNALTDPDGTRAQLAAQATATQYGYSPSGCAANGCTGFTLTALLSDGTAYTKHSF